MNRTRTQPASKTRHVIASVPLLLVLVQAGMFFVGLEVPLQRLIRLWGKSYQERQSLTWPVGRAFLQLAEQLPPDAKIYIEDPQGTYEWVYRHAFYYLYPRHATISLTDHRYEDPKEFSQWNEYPNEAWLVSNKFTYVVSFKNGIHVRAITPSVPYYPHATP